MPTTRNIDAENSSAAGAAPLTDGQAAPAATTVVKDVIDAMEAADASMDRDTEEQIRKVFHYDPPADAEILIRGKTYFEILAVFERVEKLRKLIDAAPPRELSKEWCRESAEIEGDAEIGAGRIGVEATSAEEIEAARAMLAALEKAQTFVANSVEHKRGDYPAARLSSELFDAIAAAKAAGIKAGA